MACSASTLLASGIANGLDDLSEKQLLGVIAQEVMTWADTVNGGDNSAAAVLDRACTSEIACSSEKQLWQEITQDLCNMIT